MSEAPDQEVARRAAAFQLAISHALQRYDHLTPAEREHMRHAQRIDFAFGQVAVRYNPAAHDFIRDKIEQKVGPCPCGCTPALAHGAPQKPGAAPVIPQKTPGGRMPAPSAGAVEAGIADALKMARAS